MIRLGGYKCLACHSESEDTNFEASMQVKMEERVASEICALAVPTRVPSYL